MLIAKPMCFWRLSLLFALPIIMAMSSIIAVKGQSVKSLEKKAGELLVIEDYEKALPVLLTLDSLKPLNGEVNYLIGICYLQKENKKDALQYLEKALSLNYLSPKLDYNLGKLYHSNHQFDKAISLLENFKTNFKPKSELEKKKIKEVNRLIEMSKNGIELLRNPLDVQITNLGEGINTIFPEYVPLISADESMLIFTSRRADSVVAKGKNLPNEDIFISFKDSTGRWKKAEKISKEINTEGHEASIALSPEGTQLYLYKDFSNGDIYISDYKEGKWTSPVRLNSNINTLSWEPSASISPDQKKLYFVSSRPGGYGGTDLYLSTKQTNGDWGPAINLGPQVNTPFDEDAPFIHMDGKTLYFSSEGHNSMGGYDIFTTIYDEETKKWAVPINIGYPINTAGDDDYFVWSPDGKRGYFSSEREDSYGKKDIYMVSRKETNVDLIFLKGKVFAKGSHKPVEAKIVVTDNSSGKTICTFTTNNLTSTYSVFLTPGKNYGISVEAKGFLPYSENIDIPNQNNFLELNKDIAMVPLESGSKVVLKNVFFESGKVDLKRESFAELDNFKRILIENPTVCVEIAGHTDNVGVEEDNIKLSEERATAVFNYLEKSGISKERMYAKGYGEAFPVASNESSDTRKENRRTELIIVDCQPIKNKNKSQNGYYNTKPLPPKN